MWPIISPIVSILALKRTCPVCGKTQIVPKHRRHETVVCHHCGAEIPPPGEGAPPASSSDG